MSWNINSVVIIGRLVRDVTIKNLQTATVANFDIAVGNRPDKDGTITSSFFNVEVWGKQGENCAKFLSKGKLCCVKGNLIQKSWETKDGRKEKKIIINAEQVEFLSIKHEPETAPDKSLEETFYDNNLFLTAQKDPINF